MDDLFNILTLVGICTLSGSMTIAVLVGFLYLLSVE